LAKGALFLSGGNLRRAAGARTVDEVGGMAALTPRSAGIFLTGVFVVTAAPPFAPFFSELRVLRAAFEGRHVVTISIFLGCLFLAFLGMTRLVLSVVEGRPRATARAAVRRTPETAGVILPPLALLVLTLWLGVATPEVLRAAWSAAVEQLFAGAH
jgi:hydrogenase-4 component F